ncbi:hypothetical protein HK102_004322 [Quaeritorhiza haematococci]|nr:hypothetical protein HK102_004322 [Quaeritorhiza haematococci]
MLGRSRISLSLVLLLPLIHLATALRIPRTDITIENNLNKLQRLEIASFDFNSGGKVSVSLSNLKVIDYIDYDPKETSPQQPALPPSPPPLPRRHQLLFSICPTEFIRSLEISRFCAVASLASNDSSNLPCDVLGIFPKFDESTGTSSPVGNETSPAVPRFNSTQNVVTSTNSTTGGQFVIQTVRLVDLTHQSNIERSMRHSLVIVKCSAQQLGLYGAVEASLTNPGPFFIQHLSAGEIPLFFVYLVSSVLWFLFLLAWLAHWFIVYYQAGPASSSSIPKIPFHRLLVLYPTSQLLYTLYAAGFYGYYGSTGSTTVVVDVFLYIMQGLAVVVLYTCLMLMTKGWCVIRTRLSPLEIRSILSSAIFLAISDVFYVVVGKGAVIALVIFTVTTYLYMFWSMRIHLDTLTAYVMVLKSRFPETDQESSSNGDSSDRQDTHNISQIREGTDPDYEQDHEPTTPTTDATRDHRNDNTNRGTFQAIFSGLIRRRQTNSIDSKASNDGDTPSSRSRSNSITHSSAPKPTTLNGTRIHTLDENWDLISSYEGKLNILRHASRLVTTFATATLVIRVSEFLEIFPASPSSAFSPASSDGGGNAALAIGGGGGYVTVGAWQLVVMGGWCLIAYLYRLRKPAEWVIIPEWVVGGLGGAISTNDGGASQGGNNGVRPQTGLLGAFRRMRWR